MLPSEYVRRGWCQHTSAMDAEGLGCYPTSRAVRWCLIGGIQAAQLQHDQEADLVRWLSKRLNYITTWNDSPERTQAEVVAMLQMAEIAVLGVVHASSQ